ncbi:MAG: VanZ family protein [Vagococcus sp.]
MISLLLALSGITIYNYKHKKWYESLMGESSNTHYFIGYCFLIYLYITFKEIVGFPSISDWRRVLAVQGAIFDPNISLIPFENGILYSDYLNILLFMPLGFMIPLMWKKFDSFRSTFRYALSISLTIEIAQLFTRYRATDMNDIITNTLGAMIGWLFYKILSKFILTRVKPIHLFQSTKFFSLEPYYYLIIVLISIFLS